MQMPVVWLWVLLILLIPMQHWIAYPGWSFIWAKKTSACKTSSGESAFSKHR